MTIGDKIKIARENANLTQEELGRKCGTTKQTIYKYESGVVTNIPIDRIEMIASIVGVSSASLLGWEEKEKPPVVEGLSLEDVSPEDLKTIKAYLEMPEDQRRALAKILGVSE
jgi:transcriptional regulator with XRE-family HTH domain